MSKRKKTSKKSAKTRSKKSQHAASRRGSKTRGKRRKPSTSRGSTAYSHDHDGQGQGTATLSRQSKQQVSETHDHDGSLSQVFEALAGILVPYARLLDSEMHPNMGYCLKVSHGRPPKEIYFGSVKLQQDHVSYHLFLLYAYPDLEAQLSPELRQRLDGKTCFRIERFDASLFRELEALTRISFERFRAGGNYGSEHELHHQLHYGDNSGLTL